MFRAMKEVKEGEMGVNRAGNDYEVPQMTLKDWIAGRVILGTNIGCKPYLSVDEEKELVNFLVTCSKLGYGKKLS